MPLQQLQSPLHLLLTNTNAIAVVTNMHAATKCAASNDFCCQLCCLLRHCRSVTTIAVAAATAAAAAAGRVLRVKKQYFCRKAKSTRNLD